MGISTYFSESKGNNERSEELMVPPIIERLMYICFGIILGMMSEYIWPSKRVQSSEGKESARDVS